MMGKVKYLVGALATFITVSSALAQQDSWSDSVPKIMTLAQPYCPLKVKGRSGEWANFKNHLDQGRKVIGAVNPRRPDVVFFQLRRDGRFMFAAPRTCFEGEQNWNTRRQEEVQGFLDPPLTRRHLTLGGEFWKFSGNLVDNSGGSEALNLGYTGASLGFDWQKKRESSQWYWGAGFFAGAGLSSGSPASASSTWETERRLSFHGFAEGSAMYNFLTVPYGVGGSLMMGILRSAFTTNITNTTISTSAFQVAPSIDGRIYVDSWMLEAKIFFPGLKLGNFSFSLNVGFDI